MLYIFHGTDTQKARAKARGIIDALLKKKPDAAFFKLDDETFSTALFDEYLGGQGLFEQKYIVFLDKVFQNPDAKEVVVEKRKEIKASENIFILLEEGIDKKTLTKLEKQAEKVETQDTKHETRNTKQDFNVFSLTDSLGRRDKKQLWVLYQKALLAGKAPEEIHGVLFWQIKAMLAVVASSDTSTLPMKPFVIKKAQGFAQNYSLDELKKLSSDFISLYHDARRGVLEFDIGLEKLVLGV